jgi:hypothetical protein
VKRHAFRSALDEVRDLPSYPLIPFVPLALFAGNLLLMGAILLRVSRIERRLAVA